MVVVSNLVKKYGKLLAVNDLSLEIEKGQIYGFVGANGAGKTSILKSISGLIAPKSGEITFEGKTITGVPAQSIVKMGICHVPEGRRIFANMSVFENLELGAFLVNDKAVVKQRLEHVFQRFPRLAERKNQNAGTLSGGEQQMLAMGRALMGQPKILLLDEPSMGLAPILVQEIFEIIKEINEAGTTILVVEQNAHQALSIAQKAYVLETGKIVLSGTAEEVASSEDVKKAYLGG